MMKVVELKNVALDFGYMYEEGGADFAATVVVELHRDDETGEIEIIPVKGIAEEANEVFGVEAGEEFDLGDSINVHDLVADYPELLGK
ncbi:hypothetical protein [Ectobacillus ponti]|uniref:Uncharacterized protein n=1 Tax=Ectobacillus ponti TaxID=2961894 RepID=A0AA41XB63_9BACI|nr:hypothetical protein [Ectobacillus ponti]MCP8969735.1 hypothetical protein [Ectobacillus ponti]